MQQLYHFVHLCGSENEVAAGQTGHDHMFKVRNLLPVRASEQGNVIGLVSVYIYIYM